MAKKPPLPSVMLTLGCTPHLRRRKTQTGGSPQGRSADGRPIGCFVSATERRRLIQGVVCSVDYRFCLARVANARADSL